jgi:glycerate kinase
LSHPSTTRLPLLSFRRSCGCDLRHLAAGQNGAVRILVAPDKFGGTLSAVEAAEAIVAGWRRVAPADELVPLPMSDGGPGFVDVLAATLDGDLLPVPTSDPLGRPVVGAVLRHGTTCYVESAQACGLHLLGHQERDPMVTTSYGVGVLISAAVDSGARTVVVGLGGSGTNDGGAGMLAALGVTALDGAGRAVPHGGAALAAVHRLDGVPQLRGAALVVATDVDNPLTGPTGATAVVGRQKGATPEQVEVLDAALARWAEVVERDLPGAPAGLAALPGAGAAGGLGAGLLALGARREPGIDLIGAAVGLPAALDGVELAITGEGSFDWQSLRGKVVSGVAAAAAARGVPCLVLAGQVSVGRREMAAVGVEAGYAVADLAGSVEAALAWPADRLADLAARVARQWSGDRP